VAYNDLVRRCGYASQQVKRQGECGTWIVHAVVDSTPTAVTFSNRCSYSSEAMCARFMHISHFQLCAFRANNLNDALFRNVQLPPRQEASQHGPE
jgi:hypothetical protein